VTESGKVQIDPDYGYIDPDYGYKALRRESA